MATADTGRTAAISGTQDYDSPRASHIGPMASLPLRFVWSPDGRECRCPGGSKLSTSFRVSGDRRFMREPAQTTKQRLHRLLGERRLSWIHRRCHRQLRRSEFPRADHRGVGGVTPPMGLLAARHAAQARGEAGMINKPRMIRATGPVSWWDEFFRVRRLRQQCRLLAQSGHTGFVR